MFRTSWHWSWPGPVLTNDFMIASITQVSGMINLSKFSIMPKFPRGVVVEPGLRLYYWPELSHPCFYCNIHISGRARASS
jgi:hypothetical protein